jgi:hypothetical protein
VSKHVEELGGFTALFDEPVRYNDGLVVKVSAPRPFKPSNKAVGGIESHYIKLTVHLINRSQEKVSPRSVFLSVESGGGQAGDILDPKHRMSGPPTKQVGPGESTRWVQGFGVRDPGDVEVLVHAGVEREPVLFTS